MAGSPWTSIVVRFMDSATLGDIDTAAKKIRLFRGVLKFEPVCHSQNPALLRTFYGQLSPNAEPFNLTHRIGEIEIVNQTVVQSVQIVRCADKALKNRIPDEPS